VNKNIAETDKTKKITEVKETARRRQQRRDMTLGLSMSSFLLRQQGQDEDSCLSSFKGRDSASKS
jgi:hypothetical protein